MLHSTSGFCHDMCVVETQTPVAIHINKLISSSTIVCVTDSIVMILRQYLRGLRLRSFPVCSPALRLAFMRGVAMVFPLINKHEVVSQWCLLPALSLGYISCPGLTIMPRRGWTLGAVLRLGQKIPRVHRSPWPKDSQENSTMCYTGFHVCIVSLTLT
jgi:hypothetical protein